MKQIILFPKGQLKASDKLQLRKADFIPLEVDDPSKIVLMFPNSQQLTGDAVTRAALLALTGAHSGSERQQFGATLINMLLKATP